MSSDKSESGFQNVNVMIIPSSQYTASVFTNSCFQNITMVSTTEYPVDFLYL